MTVGKLVAFVADVGQGDEELIGIEKAKASGASECWRQKEMVADYIYPTLKQALTTSKYLLGSYRLVQSSWKRRLKLHVKVGADALCHGCTGKKVMTKFVLKVHSLH